MDRDSTIGLIVSDYAVPRTEAGRVLLRELRSGVQPAPTNDPMKVAVTGAALSVAVDWRFPDVPTVLELSEYARTVLGQHPRGGTLAVAGAEALLRTISRAESHTVQNVRIELLLELQRTLLSEIVGELSPSLSDLEYLVTAAERHAIAVVDRAAADESDGELVISVDPLTSTSGGVGRETWLRDPQATLEWVSLDGIEEIAPSRWPSTVFGRYIFSTIRRDVEQRDAWRSKLRIGGDVDLEAGLLAVFLVSLDRRFPSSDLEVVAEFAHRYAIFFKDAESGGWPFETELVIRSAIAERHGQPPPAGLESPVVPLGHLRLGATIGMLLDMRLTAADACALIRSAEDLAARNGRPLSPVITSG